MKSNKGNGLSFKKYKNMNKRTIKKKTQKINATMKLKTHYPFTRQYENAFRMKLH